MNALAPGANAQALLRELMICTRQEIEALPDRADERVHNIRVGMKKFRAIIHLAAAALAPQTLSRVDKLARKLKEHFAFTRDNDVLRELLFGLLDKEEADKTFAQVAFDEIPIAATANREVMEMCCRLEELVNGLNLGSLTMNDVLDAWAITYSSARRMGKKCRKNKNNDLLFHKWRKRVKRLFYQSFVLGECSSAASLLPQAEKLSSCLGAHHDLAVLSDRLLNRMQGSHAECIVRKRKKSIARDSLKIGKDLFRKKTSALRRKAGHSMLHTAFDVASDYP